MLRISGLVVAEAAVVGAIFALGLPIAVDVVHDLALEARLHAVPRSASSNGFPAQLKEEVAQTAGGQRDLAFALLERADDATLSNAQSMTLVTRAVAEFRDYVAKVPGDGAGWVGLSSAELARGDSGRAAAALKASILATPWSPSLVAWRCGLGIDLFRSLDDEGRELMAGQFHLQARRSVTTLVNIVSMRHAALIARILLASSPDELIAFEAELGKRK